MMYSNTRKKQKTKELNQQSQRTDVSEQNETQSGIVRRNKTLEISIPPTEKSEKYKSDGGTPALLDKLSIFPKEFDIESIGEPKQGVQAKVDYVMITTKSRSKINVVRKKEKKGEHSIINEITMSDSIKKHPDYEKIKSCLTLPFYDEKRSSGNEMYLRLKKNGDLDSYREYIKKNSSEAQSYLFHQTTNLVKALDFLHNQHFSDEQGNPHKGIIHGDIKPDNLLVDKNGNLSLSDFGCARYADKPIEQLGMVSYLSPELLRFAGGIPNNPDKSDIWSLGVTLQSLVTGEYPIAPPQSLSLDGIQHKKDARGYTMAPQSISMDHIKNIKDARGYTIAKSAVPRQADNFTDFFSDTPQGHEIRRIKAEQYLQSAMCENNLNSQRFIDDLCKKSYQDDIDKREVFGHLTSCMLSPVEVRPTAKELSIAMEKLVHYFPWDQKNNAEFVKKMTANNTSMAMETSPALFPKEEKKHIEQPTPKLSAIRQPYKESLDSALGRASTASGFFYSSSAPRTQEKETSPALFPKEEKKQIEQSSSKLSAVRQPHKELFDSVLGGTSTTSSFFYSRSTQRT